MDSNIDYTPGSPQYQFLLSALNEEQRAGATWTFVYFHHPPFSDFFLNPMGTKLYLSCAHSEDECDAFLDRFHDTLAEATF